MNPTLFFTDGTVASQPFPIVGYVKSLSKYYVASGNNADVYVVDDLCIKHIDTTTKGMRGEVVYSLWALNAGCEHVPFFNCIQFQDGQFLTILKQTFDLPENNAYHDLIVRMWEYTDFHKENQEQLVAGGLDGFMDEIGSSHQLVKDVYKIIEVFYNQFYFDLSPDSFRVNSDGVPFIIDPLSIAIDPLSYPPNKTENACEFFKELRQARYKQENKLCQPN